MPLLTTSDKAYEGVFGRKFTPSNDRLEDV